MKYIKKLSSKDETLHMLNINFNDWDEIEDDTNIILDKFFFKNNIKNKCNEIYFHQYSLLININSLQYIDIYLKKNNLDIRWNSGTPLIKLSKEYLLNKKEINLILNKGMKIHWNDVNSECYDILDFRK